MDFVELKKLRKKKRSVSYKKKYPVHFALANGDVNLAKVYLKSGISVNSKDKDGDTPLHCAVRGVRNSDECHDICEYLLSRGANKDTCNVYGKSPKNYATRRVKDGKRISNRLITGTISFRETFYHAIGKGELKKVKRWLDSGVDPNMYRDLDETPSPLSVAAKNNRIEIVKLLLSYNANVNDAYAVHQAAIMKHLPVLRLLFECGLDLSEIAFEDFSLCYFENDFLIKEDKIDSLKYLLTYGGMPINSPYICYHPTIAPNRRLVYFLKDALLDVMRPGAFHTVILIVQRMALAFETDDKRLDEATMVHISKTDFLKEIFDSMKNEIKQLKARKVRDNATFTYFDLLTGDRKSMVRYCDEETIQVVDSAVAELGSRRFLCVFKEEIKCRVRLAAFERSRRAEFRDMLNGILGQKLNFDLICCICDSLKMSDLNCFEYRRDFASVSTDEEDEGLKKFCIPL